jgi:hypothetical protein
MAEPEFNPAQALKFDFGRGHVTFQGQGLCAVVPRQALFELLAAAGDEAVRNFGHQLGVDIGRRISERLGSNIQQSPVEVFVDQLGGELALLGLGSLSVERWNRALVIVMQGASTDNMAARLLCSVVSGALQRAYSRDTAVIELMRSEVELRLLVISKLAAPIVQRWIDERVGWGEVIARLHNEHRGEA